MDKQEFTIANGISVQTRSLNMWKALLKPEVYQQVEEWALAENNKAKTGYDIKRGQDIDTYILNIQYNKKNRLIEKKSELNELIAAILEKHPELEGKITEIASISYDNVNLDTDIKDCIDTISSIKELVSIHKNNQFSR